MIILIVDDDANDQLLLIKGLERIGFNGAARAVSSGQEALDYLQGSGKYGNRTEFPLPDLIILDLVMPEMSGTELLVWLRTQPQLGDIPVIVLSGYPLGSAVANAYKLGAKTFFSKPVESAELQVLLRQATRFAQKRRRQEGNSSEPDSGNNLAA